MTQNPIKFGTDGWRGIIARDFTFDNVRICAQGTADYFNQIKSTGGIVIGYDTRFASEYFAAITAEVVAGNGLKVFLCSQTNPTPVISYYIRTKKADGGIIITASHNPAMWNGFKIKTGEGTSAPSEIISNVEENINRTLKTGKLNQMSLSDAQKQGLLERIDPDPLYFEQLNRLIDLDSLVQNKLKIIADPMYGAGCGYFEKLLGKGNINVIEINNERNPIFPGIQPEPIAINLAKLSTTVKDEKASVGLANDGDADRLGVIDENGKFLTQLQVFALLALYMLEIRGERGTLVRTITSTSMIDRLGKLYNVPVYITPVGFKYVAPVMISENALTGGEESGGYGFRGHMPERDGILAGLYFLDMMVKTGKTPSQLIDYLYSKVGPHHYDRVDVDFDIKEHQRIIDRIRFNQPKSIYGVKVTNVITSLNNINIGGFYFTLEDGSWLLIRFSGTEPVLRIYTETNSPERVKRLLAFGEELAGI